MKDVVLWPDAVSPHTFTSAFNVHAHHPADAPCLDVSKHVNVTLKLPQKCCKVWWRLFWRCYGRNADRLRKEERAVKLQQDCAGVVLSHV